MFHRRSSHAAVLAALVLAALLPATVQAQSLFEPLCRVTIDEERRELEEFRLVVDRARSDLAAFEEIFKLIDGLWKAEAIDRMSWVRGKYDRDAARLALEEAGWILRRQEALLEHQQHVCESAGTGELSKQARQTAARIYRRYQEADCGALGKAVEVAATKLEFDREWLASIHDLRAGNVATAQDVILAELNVEKEEKNLKDAQRRSESCRRELEPSAPAS